MVDADLFRGLMRLRGVECNSTRFAAFTRNWFSNDGRVQVMQKQRQLISLRDLLDEDLDAIIADLSAEFGMMSGSRLLLTAVVDFSDTTLVQSVLHWNDRRPAEA